ncbi:MAG TPA: OB-fold nucleic acid binding domain-containing protein, partial [Acetobacteraceae bacterium]|nr:OB-fold nucleic acid binding domain-containing protein [Acetobacteraceae bacterium]
VDVTASAWDCTIEAGATLRLGLRLIDGFREDWATRLMQARDRAGGLRDFPDLIRIRLPKPALEALADADAMRGLGLDRRAALWQVRGLRDEADLPLFAGQPIAVREVPLPVMGKGEHVIADYQATGLSLKAHPMGFLRASLAREGALSCAEAVLRPERARVRLAGVVLVRQRPGNGNVVFCTIEDETGTANIVVWASLAERFRRAVVGSSLLLVEGQVQRVEVVGAEVPIVHVVAERLEDYSFLMTGLTDAAIGEAPRARTSGHPRHTKVFPRSRDFQ